MSFEERLTAIRKERGMTQKSLAEACGLSHIQVNRYENGGSQPSLEALKRLAVALSVTIDELVFDGEERGPSDELRLRFEAIARLEPKERDLIKELIDTVVARHDARRIFSQFQPGTEAG